MSHVDALMRLARDDEPKGARRASTRPLQEYQEKCPEVSKLLAYLEDERTPADKTEAAWVKRNIRDLYRDDDGILYRECVPTDVRYRVEAYQQVVLPKAMRTWAFQECHDSLYGGGHLGPTKMY